jgi:hypothetical protein
LECGRDRSTDDGNARNLGIDVSADREHMPHYRLVVAVPFADHVIRAGKG